MVVISPGDIIFHASFIRLRADLLEGISKEDHVHGVEGSENVRSAIHTHGSTAFACWRGPE